MAKIKTKSKEIDYVFEFLQRGLSVRRAYLATEAIYSCALEGFKLPVTKKELDKLVKQIKEMK